MLNFSTMIHTVKTGGICDSANKPVPKHVVDKFYEYAAKAKPIIIHQEVVEPYLKHQYTKEDVFEATITQDDHPFDAVSYEILDGYYQLDDKQLDDQENGRESDGSEILAVPNISNARHVVCYLIAEDYVFALVRFNKDYHRIHINIFNYRKGYKVPEGYMVYWENQKNDNVYPIICSNLAKMVNGNFEGREKVRERVRCGSGKNKQTLTIKELVHITGKKDRGVIEISGRKIDFSHRFLRRGHWRKLKDGKLGKNRHDEDCVVGKTWVRDCTVGPEDLPLVDKVRLVVK